MLRPLRFLALLSLYSGTILAHSPNGNAALYPGNEHRIGFQSTVTTTVTTNDTWTVTVYVGCPSTVPWSTVTGTPSSSSLSSQAPWLNTTGTSSAPCTRSGAGGISQNSTARAPPTSYPTFPTAPGVFPSSSSLGWNRTSASGAPCPGTGVTSHVPPSGTAGTTTEAVDPTGSSSSSFHWTNSSRPSSTSAATEYDSTSVVTVTVTSSVVVTVTGSAARTQWPTAPAPVPPGSVGTGVGYPSGGSGSGIPTYPSSSYQPSLTYATTKTTPDSSSPVPSHTTADATGPDLTTTWSLSPTWSNSTGSASATGGGHQNTSAPASFPTRNTFSLSTGIQSTPSPWITTTISTSSSSSISQDDGYGGGGGGDYGSYTYSSSSSPSSSSSSNSETVVTIISSVDPVQGSTSTSPEPVPETSALPTTTTAVEGGYGYGYGGYGHDHGHGYGHGHEHARGDGGYSGGLRLGRRLRGWYGFGY